MTTHFCMPGGVIGFIERKIIVRLAGLIRKNRRAPIHLPGQRFRIRIDDQLLGVKPQALVRLEGPCTR